jgi:hypothetical protein
MNLNLESKLGNPNMKIDYYHICENHLVWNQFDYLFENSNILINYCKSKKYF